MGLLKDEVIRGEEAALRAAKAKGRTCAMCGETVPFDDVQPTSPTMLCAHCRNIMEKD